MPRIAVIDFETTGMSPDMGDRATEVAIVMLERGVVVDRFQSLMNAGARISPFVESLTGISNAMIRSAPSAAEVMAQASRFVGDTPLVAHNASFDRRYWQGELARLDLPAAQPFACTVLLSRRLYPEARSHALGAMAAFHQLPSAGCAHRALADAEVTAALLARIQADLCHRFDLPEAPHPLLMKIQSSPKPAIAGAVKKYLAVA
ncbi:MAG: 3'-5' exonuclease [Burkholderiales bacterium]|nr:3'-5' exonuclease [Burkholderiales bacterium]